jgi:hypothetical protein
MHTFYQGNFVDHTRRFEQRFCCHFDTPPSSRHDRQVANAQEQTRRGFGNLLQIDELSIGELQSKSAQKLLLVLGYHCLIWDIEVKWVEYYLCR